MARYLLLRVEDDQEADDLLRHLVVHPHAALLTPQMRFQVFAELVAELDPSDRLSRGDVPGLAAVVRESWERGHELAAEWEAAG